MGALEVEGPESSSSDTFLSTSIKLSSTFSSTTFRGFFFVALGFAGAFVVAFTVFAGFAALGAAFTLL